MHTYTYTSTPHSSQQLTSKLDQYFHLLDSISGDWNTRQTQCSYAPFEPTHQLSSACRHVHISMVPSQYIKISLPQFMLCELHVNTFLLSKTDTPIRQMRKPILIKIKSILIHTITTIVNYINKTLFIEGNSTGVTGSWYRVNKILL